MTQLSCEKGYIKFTSICFAAYEEAQISLCMWLSIIYLINSGLDYFSLISLGWAESKFYLKTVKDIIFLITNNVHLDQHCNKNCEFMFDRLRMSVA